MLQSYRILEQDIIFVRNPIVQSSLDKEEEEEEVRYPIVIKLMSKYPSFEAEYNIVDTKGSGTIIVRTTQSENGHPLAAHRGHLCDPDICKALRLRYCVILYQHPRGSFPILDGNAVKVDDTAVVAKMHEGEMACNS